MTAVDPRAPSHAFMEFRSGGSGRPRRSGTPFLQSSTRPVLPEVRVRRPKGYNRYKGLSGYPATRFWFRTYRLHSVSWLKPAEMTPSRRIEPFQLVPHFNGKRLPPPPPPPRSLARLPTCDPVDHSSRMFVADDFPVRRSASMSNETFWPSTRFRMPARARADA